MTKINLIVFLVIACTYCSAQTDCQNVDFEYGDFTGWTGYTGYNPGGTVPPPVNTPGIVNGRHTIMNTPGIDPHSLGILPTISPYGGNVSVRLGNDDTGSDAERLTKTIQVTATNTSLVYEYAVVFEDPSHDIEDQPHFELTILDQNGSPIADPCFNYSVTAASNLPGFQQGDGDVYFRQWTPIALDLSAYIGQTLTVEFTTYDCALGGHFGYAYFDARCTKLEIIKSTCDSNQVIISVPPGFISYLWSTGETTQSIILNNPPIGAEYSVTATSETGCVTVLETVITGDNIPQPELEVTPIFCPNGSAVTLNAPYGFNTLLWSTGDTTNQTTVINPQIGDTVTLTASNGIYCPVVLTYVIDSIPQNNASAITDFISVCVNADSAMVIGPSGFQNYNWSTGETLPSIIVQNPQVNDTLDVFVTPGQGCPQLYRYIINDIQNGPSAVFTSEFICNTVQNYFLNAGEGSFSYQWSTGQTTSNINVPNPQVGDTISVTIGEYNGCISVLYYVFQEYQTTVDTTYNTINTCIHTPYYNLQAPGGYVSYLWSTGAQGYQTLINTPQQGQQVVVTMSGQNGCNAYAGYTFNLIDNFPDDLEISISNFCATTKQVNLNAPDGYAVYVWSTGEYDQSITITDPVQNDVYNVILSDYNGCKDTTSITLTYNNLPAILGLQTQKVDVFTPDNDAINDDFGIDASDYDYYELEIYNRWGTKVFTSTSHQTRWDGKINGQNSAGDVYYYIFKVKACGNTDIVTRKGNVTLLRTP